MNPQSAVIAGSKNPLKSLFKSEIGQKYFHIFSPPENKSELRIIIRPLSVFYTLGPLNSLVILIHGSNCKCLKSSVIYERFPLSSFYSIAIYGLYRYVPLWGVGFQTDIQSNLSLRTPLLYWHLSITDSSFGPTNFRQKSYISYLSL